MCFADFGKRRGRGDNLMYHISDGFNLNGKSDEETHFDKYLTLKLAQKRHEYHLLQQGVVD